MVFKVSRRSGWNKMIIVISGAVGTGKSTIADELGERLRCAVAHLNDKAGEYKLQDVKEKQTFDFDLHALIEDVEQGINDAIKDDHDLILESHFAHFINPELVDYLFVINRDQKDLERVYDDRGYDFDKTRDNLEAENFNVCFYEAIEEGYKETTEDGELGQVFSVQNDFEISEVINDIMEKIND